MIILTQFCALEIKGKEGFSNIVCENCYFRITFCTSIEVCHMASLNLDGQNHQSPFANHQCPANADNSPKQFGSSAWNEDYTNQRQSRDWNHSASNAGSTRTKFCVLRGSYDRQRALVIRIAARTLASRG